MPIPVSAVSLLISGHKFKKERWPVILQQKLLQIKPYLESATLPTLGKQAFLVGERAGKTLMHSLEEDNPEFKGDMLFKRDINQHPCEIDIQGIWGGFMGKDVRMFHHPLLQVFHGKHYGCGWGVSRRTGDWVLVEILGDVTEEAPSLRRLRGKPDHWKFDEKATSFAALTGVPIDVILKNGGFDPFSIWQTLNAFVKHFVGERERLHKEAVDLLKIVELEEHVMNSIQANEFCDLEPEPAPAPAPAPALATYRQED